MINSVKVFVTANYSFKTADSIKELCEVVQLAGHEPFCFATAYPPIEDPKKLMSLAKKELLTCEGLIYDATDNDSVGRLLEAGIAYAAGKVVIVIAKNGTLLKPTLEGVASAVIYYSNIKDLVEPLKKLK
jgi:hypothetical protein